MLSLHSAKPNQTVEDALINHTTTAVYFSPLLSLLKIISLSFWMVLPGDLTLFKPVADHFLDRTNHPGWSELVVMEILHSILNDSQAFGIKSL